MQRHFFWMCSDHAPSNHSYNHLKLIMDYPISVLHKDKDRILKSLRKTRAWINYPKLYRESEKKVEELKKAIELIEQREKS